jgi:hypothetical protein
MSFTPIRTTKCHGDNPLAETPKHEDAIIPLFTEHAKFTSAAISQLTKSKVTGSEISSRRFAHLKPLASDLVC